MTTVLMTEEEHAAELERAREKFSTIDAEIDAQISALPMDTVEEDRDRKLLTSSRELIANVARRGNITTLDGTLASLDTCTQMMGGLSMLDCSQQYMGLDADRYAQMVLVAVAVYIADVVCAIRPDCRFQLEFNETGALREVTLIDDTDEDLLRMLRLLTLCMKCQQSFSAHDLRRAVDDWIGKRPS